MGSRETEMDQDKIEGAWTVLAVFTAATMGCLARMVYADKHIPGRLESFMAIISSAGSAVFVAPPVATYIAHKFDVEPDLTFIGAVAWVFGVIAINVVVLLAGLDLKKWMNKWFGGKGE